MLGQQDAKMKCFSPDVLTGLYRTSGNND